MCFGLQLLAVKRFIAAELKILQRFFEATWFLAYKEVVNQWFERSDNCVWGGLRIVRYRWAHVAIE